MKYEATCPTCKTKRQVDDTQPRRCGNCLMNGVAVTNQSKLPYFTYKEVAVDSKECIQCGETKSLKDFPYNYSAKDKRQRICKECKKK